MRKKQDKNDLLLNSVQQKLLMRCALYIPKIAIYDRKGNRNPKYDETLAIKDRLREVQNRNDPDKKMK